MLRILLFLFILLFSTTLLSAEWELVWSDEFDGDTLDEKKWGFMIGDGTLYGLPSGWGNNELQYYRKENALVHDGHLVIRAKKEKYNGYNFTSARIRTKGKHDWLYGKFEIRAKMPIGQGLWAALWMLPTNNKYGGWATSGEVDMVEYLGHECNTVHGTLHFGGQWPQNQQKGKAYSLKTGAFHENFHTFTYEWEEGKMRWYVDGNLFQTQGKGDWWSSAAKFPAPFDDYFHLLFNLAVGGNWPGSPDASTLFPQDLIVDYVRVFKRAETDVDEKKNKTPSKFGMIQNYPNPFNPDTLIIYNLSQDSNIDMAVYNIQGERIQTLVQRYERSGQHSVVWNGLNETGTMAQSGIYFCCLKAGSQSDIIKMTLIQ